MIDKELILHKTKKYGNNFPIMTKLLNNYIKVRNITEFSEQDVAMVLVFLKMSRLYNDPTNEDSMKDFLNYTWFAHNYDEYVNDICSEPDYLNSMTDEEC